MEIGTTIIGLVSVALCVVPLIIIGKSKRNKEKGFLTSLQGIASAHNCKIATHDFGIDFSIGLADNNQFVFFYKKLKENEIKECIPFSSIASCKVFSGTHQVKTKEGNETRLDKLELIFQPKDRSFSSTSFEFFNVQNFTQPNGEIQLARKWETIVKERLNSLT